jgi:hypothetical protein
VAITKTDVLQPGGDIEPKLFPHLSQVELEARIDSYIAEGETKAADLVIASADVDRAVLAWTYYRTYFSIYTRLIGTPARATIAGQGDRSYDLKQAQAFLDLANKWKGIFDVLVPPEEATTPAYPESSSFIHKNVF